MMSTQAREILNAAFAAGHDPRSRTDFANETFWRPILPEFRPDGVYIATSSNRKRLLIALQLALLNNYQFPEQLADYQEDENPLHLLQLMKQLYSNTNGEADDIACLGHLFGVPVWAFPNNGETHAPGATQQEEATAKAQILAGELEETAARPIGTYVTIGLDTMDMVAMPHHENPAAHSLSKPRSLLKTLTHYDQGNPDDVEAFKHWYIDQFFPHGAELRGVTAIALALKSDELLAEGKTELFVHVDAEAVQQVMEHFDLNGSGGGLLQFLINFEETSLALLRESGKLDTLVGGATSKAQEHFLILCQILGVPMWEVAILLRRSLTDKSTQAWEDMKLVATEAQVLYQGAAN